MNKLIENFILGTAFAIGLSFAPLAVPAQNPRTEPPAPKAPPSRISYPDPKSAAKYPQAPEFVNDYERSIKVSSNANLTLCVREGAIRVNGWSRNEVRVFVQHGTKFGFQTLQKNDATGEAEWIKLGGVTRQGTIGSYGDCLSGGEIEIDAPTGSTVIIKGLDISTTIDTIKKVDVTSIGGDVSLRHISNGISVNSGRGDITVEGSDGAMNLSTTTGNILVFEASPREIGDVFKANTSSGAVALQALKYRQINVDSITGSVGYTGEILSSGNYSMRTSKGSIRLTLPLNSSFDLFSTTPFGSLATELPLDISTENITPGPVKTVRAKSGKGGATVRLTTNNGSISIKKM